MYHFTTLLVCLLSTNLGLPMNIKSSKYEVELTCRSFSTFPGANAVEFIINHAEVSIAFVQENKVPSVSSHIVNFRLSKMSVFAP